MKPTEGIFWDILFQKTKTNIANIVCTILLSRLQAK